MSRYNALSCLIYANCSSPTLTFDAHSMCQRSHHVVLRYNLHDFCQHRDSLASMGNDRLNRKQAALILMTQHSSHDGVFPTAVPRVPAMAGLFLSFLPAQTRTTTSWSRLQRRIKYHHVNRITRSECWPTSHCESAVKLDSARL